jgi:hypothetical protein
MSPSAPKIPQAKRENTSEIPTTVKNFWTFLQALSRSKVISALEQRESLRLLQYCREGKKRDLVPSPGSEISPDPGPNNRLMRIRNRRSVERAPSERNESSAALERQSASRNVKI